MRTNIKLATAYVIVFGMFITGYTAALKGMWFLLPAFITIILLWILEM